MPRTYGATARNVKPATLPDDILLAIGRLVRACAEIEDMIDLFIASLASIDERRTTILLGRTAITRRLEIALDLAKVRTDAALKVHKQVFNYAFDDIVECRNTVAHGKLLGKTEDGYAFLTAFTGPVTEDSAVRIVKSYTPESIKLLAKAAETNLPKMAKALQIEELLEARLQKPLLPHRKAQPQGNAKRRPQPQS